MHLGGKRQDQTGITEVDLALLHQNAANGNRKGGLRLGWFSGAGRHCRCCRWVRFLWLDDVADIRAFVLMDGNHAVRPDQSQFLDAQLVRGQAEINALGEEVVPGKEFLSVLALGQVQVGQVGVARDPDFRCWRGLMEIQRQLSGQVGPLHFQRCKITDEWLKLQEGKTIQLEHGLGGVAFW